RLADDAPSRALGSLLVGIERLHCAKANRLHEAIAKVVGELSVDEEPRVAERSSERRHAPLLAAAPREGHRRTPESCRRVRARTKSVPLALPLGFLASGGSFF